MVRFSLGTLFLLAGLAKVLGLERFVDAVRGYRLISEARVGTVAAGLAVTEALLGGLLLAGMVVSLAAAIATALLVLFSSAVALNLRRGRRNACGCMGILAGRDVSGAVLLRNAVLAVAALALALMSSPVAFARQWDTRNVSTDSTIAMLITGTVFIFVVAVVEEGVRVLKLQISSRRGFAS